MLKKMQLLLIGLFFCLFLFGIQSQAFAETINQSVKDCLEQPENCGEEQGTEVIDEQTDGEQLEASKESKAIGLTLWGFSQNDLCHPFCSCTSLCCFKIC